MATATAIGDKVTFLRLTTLPKVPDEKTGLFPEAANDIITPLPATLRSNPVDLVLRKGTSKGAAFLKAQGQGMGDLKVVQVWSLDVEHADGTLERRDNVEQGNGPNQWMPAS